MNRKKTYTRNYSNISVHRKRILRILIAIKAHLSSLVHDHIRRLSQSSYELLPSRSHILLYHQTLSLSLKL
ncbi:unnamed protein product [Clavelina lepadiformis]|uniref:Uncharacterized protein n=1 Tax=Clavelina lepadiformis TaxID=159417 RepID=A0ABP0FCW2_CLALP